MKLGSMTPFGWVGTIVLGALAGATAGAQEKAKPTANPTSLSGTDANADYQTVRAAYEALDGLKTPDEQKAGFEKLKPLMAEFVKHYDGKITVGPALVALAMAQKYSGDAQKGARILEDYQKNLVGKVAPSLEVWKVVGGGDSWSLDQAKGKVVLIDFWATWCPPCRELIPSLVQVSNDYKDKGLVVIGATQLWGRGWLSGESKKNLDQAAEIKVNEDFKADMKIPYAIVFGKKNSAMFNYAVTGIPTVFLIDKSGKVRWIGGSGDHDALKKKIDELLAENAQ